MSSSSRCRRPDMPAALLLAAVDAIISGEPFMAQTEMDGYGRVLFMTKDVWPEFISCVLAVRERTDSRRAGRSSALVDGIASSGKWLDQNDGPPDAGGEFRRAGTITIRIPGCCGSCSANRRTGSSTRT